MYKFAIGLFASTTGLFSEHLLAQDDARSDGFEKSAAAIMICWMGRQPPRTTHWKPSPRV